MKRNKLLLTSAILGTAYFLYIIQHFASLFVEQDDVSAIIGAGLASILIGPHVFVLLIAVVINWIGWSSKAPWAALTGAILYCVSAFLFLLYTPFLVLQIIFSFVAYAKMKKKKKYILENVEVIELSSDETTVL